MEEIAPGLWHWKALRESIGSAVSSYYLDAERVLIDPMVPPEGLMWFEDHGRPEHLLLTNRHHDRDAWELRDAFGCSVHCVRNGHTAQVSVAKTNVPPPPLAGRRSRLTCLAGQVHVPASRSI